MNLGQDGNIEVQPYRLPALGPALKAIANSQ